jgi:hypothetical protein
VRVAAGAYDIDTTIMLIDSLALIGAGMDLTTLSWQGADFEDVIFGRVYDYISGFEIDGNCPPHSIYGAAAGIKLRNTVHLVEIAGCRIRRCNPAVSATWVTLEIHDCEIICDHIGVNISPYALKSIHHNTFYGHYYAVTSWSEADIYGNVFHLSVYGRGFTAIHQKFNWGVMSAHNNLFIGGARAIGMEGPDLAYISNNTIINASDNSWGPIGIYFPEWGGGSTVWITNNIFQNCQGQFGIVGAEYGTCTYHFTYNVIWPPKDPLYMILGLVDIDSIGVIFADPMLSSDSSFYLQAGSPCIDAGDPTILDVDGSRSDIGMYGGPRGMTYTYPQEAPKPPDTLTGQDLGTVVLLTWLPNTESDLAEYRVYRDSLSGFVLQPENLIANVDGDAFTHVDSITGSVSKLFYVLTAVDTAGLESPPSNEVAIFLTGILGEEEPSDIIPRTPYLTGCYPNPFNTSTTIEYYIPDLGARPTQVQLVIYDILGRKVATIVKAKQYPGNHRARWNGQSGTGVPVASGIYFARLTIWGYEFESSVKIVLQK